MKNVFSILSQLEQTSGKLDKERILKENSSNELLKKTLQYALNPYLIYGIGAKSIKPETIVTREFMSEDIFALLDWLASNNGGSDEAKYKVNKFLSQQTEEGAEWYKRIILKDLRIGATESTVNKVFPKLIPEFKIMLAKKYEDHEHKITDDFIITTKLDGVRVVILKENSTVKMMSRQGRVFEDFDELMEEIEQLPDNMVYDGEFLVTNTDDLDSKELFRATMKEVSKKGKKHNVEFHIFDILPINEFKNGKSKDKAIERKTHLKTLLELDNFKWIKKVPALYIGQDKNKVFELLEIETSKGLEGIMVNQNMPYFCKRSDSVLKVKKFETADVRVLGVEEGTNKNIGKLGSILIQFEHDGLLHTCNVGSGFSDEERVLFYNSPELIVGKIVEIGYFEITNNQKDDAYSLRFPTWKGIIRHDKTEISMY